MKRVAVILLICALFFVGVGCSVVYRKPIMTVTADGFDISRFAIVYPNGYDKMQAADMQAFADEIKAATDGVELRVGTESEMSETEHEIRIGAVRGADYSELGDLDCRIAVKDGNIYLGGNNYYADIRAVYRFAREILGIKYDGNFDETFVTLSSQDNIVKWEKPAVIINGWCTHSEVPFNTEERFATAREAGFNMLSIWDRKGQDLHNVLKWAAAYDIQLLFMDWYLYGKYDLGDYSTATPEVAKYIKTPVVYGNYLVDEPSLKDFDAIAQGKKDYEASTGKTAFINLFPKGAQASQLGCDSYEEYVRTYLDKVKPDMLYVDIYSLRARSTSHDLIENLSLIKDILREDKYSNISLGVYVQGIAFNADVRTPKSDDLHWQMYVALCFGVDSIGYFTYLPVLGQPSALLDLNGNTTAVWDGVKDVNTDLAAFVDVYDTYEQVGVFGFNCTEKITWVELHEQIDFSDVITLEGKDALLVGCFENGDGGHAFILSNQKNLLSFRRPYSEAKVSVRLTKGKSLTVWQSGVSTTYTPDENGLINLVLERGEGVFCVVNGEK